MKGQERHEPEEKRLKRSYVPPSIQRVELRPEEAVLGFCKNDTTGGGPMGAKCKSVTACSAQGS